ncbi:rho-related BTB domain-containing protein 1-like isoform X1 [Limulus polyphemus]|uniref:Rho-related BTB domain-containing protein 1-like isoform X1 n=2 Tax=Limulus polyphemus TaxID=6850 RepID=A0ABM1SVZ0_LIMPO|nr:rho-related BTB domain-containing protein 1-like isoform X1 [Limulus polyphemus]XP_022247797.1 rho-related BTB domain-containing protein 1-like isoform X1 [Limulus polyphemus]
MAENRSSSSPSARGWTAMDNEQPHQENVKCVVVGDTAVGKTRLICARACNARLTLSQLMTHHIPTVWAIDQYRIYKEVLERSWDVVDGVSISLRLWDTFGDHDKDRRFAYGRSDVVLLCFSIANPLSLRNCKVVWYPEIRKFCPNTPIVLVGCKNDLRYIYRDEEFLSLCRDRSPFFRGNHPCVSSRNPELGRPLRETDILTPEHGRMVAKEIGAPYYETSVLTHYGVNEVFENIIRVALIARRQQRFWMTNLKHVQHPLLQVPFCPPKQPSPSICVPDSQFENDMLSLFHSQVFTDVIFLCGKIGFSAHKAVLAAISGTFFKLFTMDLSPDISTSARSSSESSMVSTLEAAVGSFNDDTEQLISQSTPPTCASLRLPRSSNNNNNNSGGSNIANSSGAHTLPQKKNSSEGHSKLADHSNKPTDSHSESRTSVCKILNQGAFQSISLEPCEGLDHRGEITSSMQTVVTMSKQITPAALQQCLRFLYTGSVDLKCCSLTEVHLAAELLEIPELQVIISNILHREDFLNQEVRQKFLQKLKARIKEICVKQGLFSDVLFQLEDGLCAAHRPMLVARCDMMAAMFRGDFRESSAKVVHFPGVTKDCFHQLLVYLYTDCIDPTINPNNCLDLLELANRLCLARLVALVEQKVVRDLIKMAENKIDSTEHAIRLLEPCQMHNADQLADWCLFHISVNYNEICQKSIKLLRTLHPENQAYLNRNRWPPVWYLKEFDFYERCLREREWQENPPKALKRQRSNGSGGCLCFSGKTSSDGPKWAFHTV